jgi:hypothetical protein
LAIQLEGCAITLPESGGEVSEAMLFGIGGGVGCGVFQFVYEKNDFSSFYLAGRCHWDDSLAWYRGVLKRLGLECEVFETGGKRAAAKTLGQWLERGRPVIAWVDAGSLPYRGLGGFLEGGGYHTLSVYGETDGQCWLGDLAPESISVETGLLADARARIQKHRNRLLQVTPGEVDAGLPDLVWGGLEYGWRALQNPRVAGFSLAALETWAKRLAGSGGKHAWATAFPIGHRLLAGLTSITRFIESFDGDGCLHRRLMAQFLREAGELLGEPELLDLAGDYDALADAWQDLARAALPDEITPLAELRRGLVGARAGYLDSGPGARAQNEAAVAAIEQFGADLAGGRAFPIAPAEVPGFLASLSEMVLEIAAAENAAQEKIGALLSDRGQI